MAEFGSKDGGIGSALRRIADALAGNSGAPVQSNEFRSGDAFDGVDESIERIAEAVESGAGQGAPGGGGTAVTPNITATASVDDSGGTPSVTVTKTGTQAAPSFRFAFTGLRGADGAPGRDGVDGRDGAKGDKGDPADPAQITLASLSDVSAPSPVSGQVLTFDGAAWTPRANQAAGFPGLAALDWRDPLSLGMTRGSLPIVANNGQFLIAKFQNQVFFRMDSVKLSTNLTTGQWYPAFTNVPAEWLSPTNNELAIAQTWGPSKGGSVVAVCAGNSPSTIWILPVVWNTGDNYLHGIVTWYV